MFANFSKSTSDAYNQIRSAVLNKQHVFANYNGYYRELCLHVIGWNNNGKEQDL